MSDREIAQAWERAERLVQNIYSAYITGIGLAQARKDQQSLRLWLQMVREYRIVYNGCYDEYANLKL